ARIGLFVLVVSTLRFTMLIVHTTFTYLATSNALRKDAIAIDMMQMTTLAVNLLPNEPIAHATARNNTFGQMASTIGTPVFIILMSVLAILQDGIIGIIHGVNVTFIVATVISAIGLLLSFKLTDDSKPKRRTL